MPIHVSVELSHVCPLDEIPAHIKVLENGGFHRVWVPDAFVTPWEAWLTAGLIAERTERLKIGVGVMNPYTRHPMVTAQMATMLQSLSSGRLALSIGSGIPKVLDKAGITGCKSAVEEYITSVRGLTEGERVSLEGEAYRLEGLKLRAIPPEVPIPIYLAAVSPASWETAVRVADGAVTFWNDEIVKTRRQAMQERSIPTAALVGYTLSEEGILGQKSLTQDDLYRCFQAMAEEGIDEIMIGYRDLEDLAVVKEVMGE